MADPQTPSGTRAAALLRACAAGLDSIPAPDAERFAAALRHVALGADRHGATPVQLVLTCAAADAPDEAVVAAAEHTRQHGDFHGVALPISRCRSCGSPVVWATTSVGGKKIPIDPDPVSTGNLTITRDAGRGVLAHTAAAGSPVPRYVSHFATCPNAAQHRRPR